MLQILQARSFSPYQDIINTLDIDDEIFSIEIGLIVREVNKYETVFAPKKLSIK